MKEQIQFSTHIGENPVHVEAEVIDGQIYDVTVYMKEDKSTVTGMPLDISEIWVRGFCSAELEPADDVINREILARAK